MPLFPEETNVLTIVRCLCVVPFAFSLTLYRQNTIFQNYLGCSFLSYLLSVVMLFICNAFKFMFHRLYSILGSSHPNFIYLFIRYVKHSSVSKSQRFLKRSTQRSVTSSSSLKLPLLFPHFILQSHFISCR